MRIGPRIGKQASIRSQVFIVMYVKHIIWHQLDVCGFILNKKWWYVIFMILRLIRDLFGRAWKWLRHVESVPLSAVSRRCDVPQLWNFPGEWNKLQFSITLAQAIKLHQISFNLSDFKINNQTYCSNYSHGGICHVKCEDLARNDISKAAQCAKTIFDRDGFKVWYKWTAKCKPKRPEELPSLTECFKAGNRDADFDDIDDIAEDVIENSKNVTIIFDWLCNIHTIWSIKPFQRTSGKCSPKNDHDKSEQKNSAIQWSHCIFSWISRHARLFPFSWFSCCSWFSLIGKSTTDFQFYSFFATFCLAF